MPDNNRKTKYGIKPSPSSYQKGGDKYQEGTVDGKKYEGKRYSPDKSESTSAKKEIVEVDNIMDATDPTKEYVLKHPYQRNRILKQK